MYINIYIKFLIVNGYIKVFIYNYNVINIWKPLWSSNFNYFIK
jgi:hypothetical protein